MPDIGVSMIKSLGMLALALASTAWAGPDGAPKADPLAFLGVRIGMTRAEFVELYPAATCGLPSRMRDECGVSNPDAVVENLLVRCDPEWGDRIYWVQLRFVRSPEVRHDDMLAKLKKRLGGYASSNPVRDWQEGPNSQFLMSERDFVWQTKSVRVAYQCSRQASIAKMPGNRLVQVYRDPCLMAHSIELSSTEYAAWSKARAEEQRRQAKQDAASKSKEALESSKL
jgi:hypothetical protein